MGGGEETGGRGIAAGGDGGGGRRGRGREPAGRGGARQRETLELASRHLDPSLVDVLGRCDSRFEQFGKAGVT